jgi:hypothetical protein
MLLLDEKYLGKYFMAILASTLWIAKDSDMCH